MTDCMPDAAKFTSPANGTSVLAANVAETTPQLGIGSVGAAGVPILKVESGMTWPRVVTAQSINGDPFDMLIEWTGGQTGPSGTVVASATGGVIRVTINAKDITAYVAGWLSRGTTVFAGIKSDVGSRDNGLHRLVRAGALAGGGGLTDIVVPRYAQYVEVILSNNAQLPLLNITFRGVASANMATQPANAGRIPIPPASVMRLINTNPGAIASYVVDFTLGL